jgi:hypothetical protein
LTNVIEFVAWDKTPRWNRDLIITEKIDGTNAAVVIEEHYFGEHADGSLRGGVALVLGPDNPEHGLPDFEYLVAAQSRKRLITPEQDNAGFAWWVHENAEQLVRDLGPGRHYGEWWGAGIQRKYGMTEKVFSLFNTRKWYGVDFETRNLTTVPILYEGTNSELQIRDALDSLREYGSAATVDFNGSDFMNPEGVCIFHTAANRVFKITLVDDEVPKSLAA